MANRQGTFGWPGAPLALASAVLFGASTPLAKRLLTGEMSPQLLAGLLYLGSGTGLAALFAIRRIGRSAPAEARLTRADLPWLALIVLSGGVVGPLLLMLGLAQTSASSAALLLNLEGLATIAMAWFIFREHVDRRIATGAICLLVGALVLSWQGHADRVGWGSVLIAGACVAWGLDNNLTRKLSAADPVQIAMVKGLVAGTVNVTIALTAGAAVPDLGTIARGALVGFGGYGVSLVLFVLALRHLGTGRTAAYFSTNSFIGALLAVVLLGDPVTVRLAGAAALMAVGLWLHLTEAHDHEHTHEEMSHTHRHVHDAHHQHDHLPSDPPGEPHTHPHRHAPLTHRHRHYPDLHHRHGH